ncbi:Glutathione S-transferase mu tandem duplicate 2 [Paragonimus heterotremus]|uniref:glutathione transferase n=1 Tax=Paragonimus heterotremus TaxID=100268 RepID=A0A8J4T061_9TREM|nr:Glutathione S-transferase mu tandem duplicate 2 [Paragonimus heterotremus]
MAPVLGYWKLRGRAQCIRLFLEYLEQPYDERLYDKCDAQKWFEEKHSKGFEFPNLPFYIDDDFKLTETVAILRYIADQHGTLGSNAKERAVISMLESAAAEMRANAAKVAYSKQPEEEKEQILKNLPRILGYWSSFLGNKEFLMGSKPIHVDFMLYENLEVLRYLDHTCLNSFENLQQFQKRIEQLPQISAYMKSSRFIKWPLHSWFSAFGGGDVPPEGHPANKSV